MLVAQLCPTVCNSIVCSPPVSSVHGILCPWNFPGKNTGVGSHSPLQGIFPTQRSNSDLLHCRQILYHLHHQGSPSVFLLKVRITFLLISLPLPFIVWFSALTSRLGITWELVRQQNLASHHWPYP